MRDYFPHPYTLNDAREFITKIASPEYDRAIVVDGKAVGGIGLIPGKDVERVGGEIGYWLGEPYWGRGIVSEATKVFSKYLFTNTDIIRLFATIFEHNHGSMRVVEKAGFSKLTVLNRAAIKNGEIIDLHYYELLKKS